MFQQEHYTENFVQATFTAMPGGSEGKTIVVGGDGRFFVSCATLARFNPSTFPRPFSATELIPSRQKLLRSSFVSLPVTVSSTSLLAKTLSSPPLPFLP